MRKREKGFLLNQKWYEIAKQTKVNTELVDYIGELHDEMWKVIKYHNCYIDEHLHICWEYFNREVLQNKNQLKLMDWEEYTNRKEVKIETKRSY